ncbi:hypothetical protein EG329_007371 [Mollisiaceae sp. DMI_Dod_QoI]|nr:hypothetical protein EG329_007371 [Helotiales sp. DMI_Dod_QoI]
MCPHKRVFVLSDGLIGEGLSNDKKKLWVPCSYHKRNFELTSDDAGKCGNDESINVATFPIEERDHSWAYVKLPPVDELDAGTEKLEIKQGDDLKAKEARENKGAGVVVNRKWKGDLVAGRIVAENGASGIDW